MVKKLVLVKNGVAHPINVGGVVTPGSYVLAFSGKNSLVFHSEDGNEITVSQGHSDSPDESIFNIFNFERDKGISFGIFELDENDNMNPKSVLYVDKDNGVNLNGKKLENVSEEYVDTKDVETLESAKEYADTQDETILDTTKGYADTQDETTLNTAKEYADTQDETTLATAKGYADTQDETTLATAKEYADTQDETTLNTAKGYADTQDETTLNTAKGYADTQDETILDTAKEYADSKVSKSGGTMLGGLDMGGHGIAGINVMDANALITTLVKEKVSGEGVAYENARTPTKSTDAANKTYVDTNIANGITEAKQYADERFLGWHNYARLMDIGGSVKYLTVTFDAESSGVNCYSGSFELRRQDNSFLKFDYMIVASPGSKPLLYLSGAENFLNSSQQVFAYRESAGGKVGLSISRYYATSGQVFQVKAACIHTKNSLTVGAGDYIVPSYALLTAAPAPGAANVSVTHDVLRISDGSFVLTEWRNTGRVSPYTGRHIYHRAFDIDLAQSLYDTVVSIRKQVDYFDDYYQNGAMTEFYHAYGFVDFEFLATAAPEGVIKSQYPLGFVPFADQGTSYDLSLFSWPKAFINLYSGVKAGVQYVGDEAVNIRTFDFMLHMEFPNGNEGISSAKARIVLEIAGDDIYS